MVSGSEIWIHVLSFLFWKTTNCWAVHWRPAIWSILCANVLQSQSRYLKHDLSFLGKLLSAQFPVTVFTPVSEKHTIYVKCSIYLKLRLILNLNIYEYTWTTSSPTTQTKYYKGRFNVICDHSFTTIFLVLTKCSLTYIILNCWTTVQSVYKICLSCGSV